jgi:hypothetical protein
MVLLLHGFLLPCVTFEGSFYPFRMSQPGESDREVFSHSMNTIAQFQSAVVVSRLVPILFSPGSRAQTRCFPLSSQPPVLRLCCGEGTSRPRQICVLSLHRPTLHGEDERKAGRSAHRITLLGRTAGSGCCHRAQGRGQQASHSSGRLAL